MSMGDVQMSDDDVDEVEAEGVQVTEEGVQTEGELACTAGGRNCAIHFGERRSPASRQAQRRAWLFRRGDAPAWRQAPERA